MTWRFVLLLAVASLACKPRVDEAAQVKADESPALGEFEALMQRLDQVSLQVATDMLSSDGKLEMNTEGFALAGGTADLEQAVRQANGLAVGILAKKDLSADERSLLTALSKDLAAT